MLPQALATARFESGDDVDVYLGLLGDVGRYVADDLERLKGQEERGILLPKPAVPGARAVFQSLREGVAALAAVAPERLAAFSPEQRATLNDGIETVLSERVFPVINTLLDYIGDEYVARAPDAVGLGQYPGGDAAYRFAIRRQTTLDPDPVDIHDRGLSYMATIHKQMRAIRDELGFEGTAEEFHDRMRDDSRFFASTPEEVEERYLGYIQRVEPHIADYFSVLPKAPYGVKRLDPAAERA